MSKSSFYTHYFIVSISTVLVSVIIFFAARVLFHSPEKISGIFGGVIAVNALAFNALKQVQDNKLSLRKFYSAMLIAAACGAIVSVALLILL